MPKINVPLENPNVTTVLNSPSATPQDVSGALGSVSAASDSTLNNAFAVADGARNDAFRAQLLKEEADSNAKLTKIVPELMTRVSDTIMNTSNAMAAIDQQVFEKDKVKREKAYSIEGMQDFQLNYIQYKESIANTKDAPILAAKWINDKTAELLSKAPTEDAKLDMMSRMLPTKISAMDEAFQYRQGVLKQERLNSLYSSLESVVKTTSLSPTNVDASVKQIDIVLGQLRDEGASKSELADLRNSYITQAYSKAVTSHIDKGDINSATAALVTQDSIDNLDEDTRTDLAGKVASEHVDNALESKKSLEKATSLQAFYTNKLSPTSPSASRIADTAFFNFKAQFGDVDNLDANGAQNYAGSVVKFFEQYHTVVGTNAVKDIVATPFNTNNVNLALANAMAVDKIMTDKTSDANKAAAKFVSSSTAAERTQIKLSMTMVDLVKTGMSPDQALRKVQEYYGNGDNQAEIVNDTKEVNKYFKENPDAPWSTTFDKWFQWDDKPSNTIQFDREFKDLTQAFYIETKSSLDPDKAPKAAAKMAAAALSEKYGVTNINGTNEIMEASPNLYFKDDAVVRKAISDTLTSYTAAHGGKIIDPSNRIIEVDGVKTPVGIQSIPNYTINQKDRKTYMLVNRESGIPIITDKGVVAVNITTNSGHFKTDKDMIESGYAANGVQNHPDSTIKEKVLSKLDSLGVFTKTKKDVIMSKFGISNQESK